MISANLPVRSARKWVFGSTSCEIAGSLARGGDAAAHAAAGWLCLAAAPTFAVMALVTGIQDGGAPSMLCSVGHNSSPLSGMVLMYALMSAFHSVPWLRLIVGLGSGARRP
jgi:hypothetical protein